MKSMIIILAGLFFAANVFAVTGDVEKSYPTPYSCPTGMTTDGEFLYLADCKSDQIYKIDPATGAVVSQFDSPGYRPQGMAFDGECLWLLDVEFKLIYRIDPETHVSVRTIWCPGERPAGLAWDGEYLWLADSGTDRILKISTEDGTSVKDFESPSGNPTGLAFDGTYLWVADRRTDRIYMVWPETGEVILMFDAPGKYAWGLATLGDKLYCADYQSDSLYAIITDDDEIYKTVNPVYESLEYTHQFRNYGPGTVTDLDIYLAVPESSPRQKFIERPVYSSTVEHDFVEDQWGQKVARFHFDEVKSGEIVQASYRTEVELSEHCFFIRPEKVGSLKDIPKEIKEKYLVDDTKFAIESETIKNAVKKAVGDEINPYWIMRKIFRYIIDNMEYERVGWWNIAPTVLERGNGSCSEYSFVFIAMCRAAGLPARYEGAIAQRGDLASEDEVFHRWCQVYLPNYGWVPVDPQGGDQERPEAQARYIGHLSSRTLVTTVGGGGSDYMGWEYNSNETWKSEGLCKLYSEKLGEWAPIDSARAVSRMRMGEEKKMK